MFQPCTRFSQTSLGLRPGNSVVLRMPPGVEAIYREVVITSGLGWVPPLAWLNHAAGAGGFWNGQLVAAGAADVEDFATQIWERYPRVTGAQAAWQRSVDPSAEFATLNDVRVMVLRVLFAHEIGHALQDKHGVSNAGIAGERGADELAGMIAEALGWPSWLDQRMMSLIGCRGSIHVCDHPSPAARVQAYLEGRRQHALRRHFAA